ncbi:MAG: hypothetical protein JWP94_260 [Mucilaginibacter sp.]|nr:hypothetical protein [Mucilaginibacter sp.]
MKKLAVTMAVIFTTTVVLSTTKQTIVKPSIKVNMLSSINNVQKNIATAD